MRYDAKADLLWLSSRPWIFIPRLIEVITSTINFCFIFLLNSSKEDEKTQRNLGKQLLFRLTKLGPCFIKLGQALSTRPDLVNKHWLEELTNLQDNLPPFSHESALSILENELGARASQLFEEFPDEPIAAASLGQVYKARLHGNYWVAVKIQRPDLEFIIRRDIVLIRSLCIVFGKLLPLNLGIGLAAIVDEFGKSLFEEIDYAQEAKNAERFSSLFSNDRSVFVPKVENLLSSKKVITTSWIEGRKLRDSKELEEAGLDTQKLIRTCVISGIKQLLDFGFFHADPHPGNLFALSGSTGDLGHIGYVDFGMMDKIDDRDRLIITASVVHLINQDFLELARDFQNLGFLSEKQNLEQITPVLKEVLGGALDESVGSFNFKNITDKFSEMMYDYPFRVPARFALIIRAVVSQEGLALRLDPNFKILAVAYPYVAQRLLSAETKEMLEMLLDIIFDNKGGLRLERVENLLEVLIDDKVEPISELIPVAKAGFNLIISKNGSSLRRSLLLSFIKNDRMNAKDFKGLISIIRKRFNRRSLTKTVLNKIKIK